MLASKDQSFNIQKVAILISEQRQRLAATVKSKTKLRLLRILRKLCFLKTLVLHQIIANLKSS